MTPDCYSCRGRLTCPPHRISIPSTKFESMSVVLKRVLSECHDSPVTCVAYNSLKREISTGSEDSLIKVWDSETGRLLKVLRGHAGFVTGLAYDSDSRLMFSCGIDGKLLVWSNVKTDPVQTIPDLAKQGASSPRRSFRTFAWHSIACRKGFVAAGGANGTIRIWKIQAGYRLEGGGDSQLSVYADITHLHKDMVSVLHFHENYLISGSYDKSIGIIQDISKADEKFVRISNAHAAAVTALAVDAASNWIVTGSFDNSLAVWSIEGKSINRVYGLPDRLSSIAYFSATRTVWIACHSVHALIYDVKTGTNVTSFCGGGGYGGDAPLVGLTYLPECHEMAGLTMDRKVALWKFKTDGPVATLGVDSAPGSSTSTSNMVECICIAPVLSSNTDTAMEGAAGGGAASESTAACNIYTGGPAGIVSCWEASSLSFYYFTHDEARRVGSAICVLARDPHTNVLCAGTATGVLSLWSSGAESQLAALQEDDGTEMDVSKISMTALQAAEGIDLALKAHSGKITALLCPSDGTIISAGEDGALRRWDAFDGHALDYVPMAHDDVVLDLAHYGPSELIASAGADRLINLWDADTLTQIGVLIGHTGDVTHIEAFHGMNAWISISRDGTLRSWDLSNGANTNTMELIGESASALCVSEYSGLVAVAGPDYVIRLYDVEAGTVAAQLRGHRETITALAVSDERQQLISAAWDGSVCTWTLPMTRKARERIHAAEKAKRNASSPSEKEKEAAQSYNNSRQQKGIMKSPHPQAGGRSKTPGSRPPSSVGAGATPQPSSAHSSAQGVREVGGGGGDESETSESEEEYVPYAQRHPLERPRSLDLVVIDVSKLIINNYAPEEPDRPPRPETQLEFRLTQLADQLNVSQVDMLTQPTSSSSHSRKPPTGASRPKRSKTVMATRS